ncbi:hypothetical protein [Streptacidiphilus cavernicola]|uniref:Uncharacterized protein n=1 Tax=Streptacidiphilus cavernicola TaxID=3342716 RepID=A0ABV6VYF7_9ACTN
MLSAILLAIGAATVSTAILARNRLAKHHVFGLQLLGSVIALSACIADDSLHRVAAAPAAAAVYLLFAWWLAGGVDRMPAAHRLRRRYVPDLVKTPRP